MRFRLPQLQAVPTCVRGTALLAVVDAFSRVVRSLATASSDWRFAFALGLNNPA